MELKSTDPSNELLEQYTQANYARRVHTLRHMCNIAIVSSMATHGVNIPNYVTLGGQYGPEVSRRAMIEYCNKRLSEALWWLYVSNFPHDAVVLAFISKPCETVNCKLASGKTIPCYKWEFSFAQGYHGDLPTCEVYFPIAPGYAVIKEYTHCHPDEALQLMLEINQHLCI